MFFPARLALCSALVLSASTLCHAQPTASTVAPQLPATPPNAAVATRIEPLTVNGELRLTVEVHHGDVVETLGKIAQSGNLQMLVRAGVGGVVNELSLQRFAPEAALQQFCQAAGLSCELKDDVWIISPKKAVGTGADKAKLIDALVFSDVDAEKLLSLIATQFDLPVAIAEDVSGKITYLRIQNKTPRQALDLICLAADLRIKEVEDGTFIVSRKPL